MKIWIGLWIVNTQSKGVENDKKIEEKKNKLIEEVKINSVSKKNEFHYLRYLKGEEEEKRRWFCFDYWW